MTHIPSHTSHDSDVNAFISSIDPKSMRDGRHLREISAARRALEQAEGQLIDAVRAARSAGDSWTVIGIALRTSKQNAHRKYANLLGEEEPIMQPTVTQGLESSVMEAVARASGVGSKRTGQDSSSVKKDEKPSETNWPNVSRHVVPGANGGWDIVTLEASPVLSHHDTQKDAINRGRNIISSAGGGELKIHGRDGTVRAKDIIPADDNARSTKS